MTLFLEKKNPRQVKLIIIIKLTSRKYAYCDTIYVKTKKGKPTKLHISSVHVCVYACIMHRKKSSIRIGPKLVIALTTGKESDT